MRLRRKLLIAGTLTIAACDSAVDEPAPANNGLQRTAARSDPAPAETTSKPERQPASARLDELDGGEAAPKPAAPDPGAVTRIWFAGRWTDTGDCADAGEFARNGTYRLADGTRGMWNVTGGRLVIQHAEGRSAVRVRRIDDTTIEIVNEDGSTGRSTRC